MSTKNRVSFAHLKKASPAERRRLIAHIADSASQPVNGRLDEIRSNILRFEEIYGISSEHLLRELYHGERRETDDVLPWLRLIRLRDRLESKQT